MHQLNLFDIDYTKEIETDLPMTNDQTTKEKPLLTVEELEAIPVVPHGKIVPDMLDRHSYHRSEGNRSYSRAIATEWVVKQSRY